MVQIIDYEFKDTDVPSMMSKWKLLPNMISIQPMKKNHMKL